MKYFKYEDDESIVKIVDSIADELDLSQFIDFQVLGGTKGKEVVKVVKANDFAEAVSDREDLVFVVVRDDAFQRVDEKTQYMWIRMELDKVSYDSEKGKVNVGCPCITVPIGMAEKYGNEVIDSAKLAIYTLSQINDEKKAEKAAKKGRKKQQAE